MAETGGEPGHIERDGEKGATYEVEVTKPDGSQVDVRLDERFHVVAVDSDHEALLMVRRLVGALRVALREEDFARILTAGLTLIVVGTLAYSLGSGWSVVVVVGIAILVEIARRLGTGFIVARAQPKAKETP